MTGPTHIDRTPRKRPRCWLMAGGIAILVACGGGSQDAPHDSDLVDAYTGPFCEVEVPSPSPLPRVTKQQLSLDYWLEQLAKSHDIDATLMNQKSIRLLNAANSVPRDGFFPQDDLRKPVDMTEKVAKRIATATAAMREGKFVLADGKAIPPAMLAAIETKVSLADASPEVRIALGQAPLKCTPQPQSYYKPDLDLRFDRNNTCSTAHAQEPLVIVKTWPNGMMLARARYYWGWLPADTKLSPPLSDKESALVLGGKKLHIETDTITLKSGETVTIPSGALLTAADRKAKTAFVATETGMHKTQKLPRQASHTTTRPLTRRAVLNEAFQRLGQPYGLGGVRGGIDCSRLLLDIFATFGISLPRASAWQAKAGQFSIDVEGTSERDKQFMIDAANKRGIVLLHFPGHIMLYLGKNADNRPMALHGFAEYLRPCDLPSRPDAKADTVVKVDKITVSDLELGRDTERKAFIERITKIVVLADEPGSALEGAVTMRPAANMPIGKCRSKSALMFVSPGTRHTKEPIHIVAALRKFPGAAEMRVYGPDKTQMNLPITRLGGPPYGLVTDIQTPKPGHYKVVVADGDNLLGCRSFSVQRSRPWRSKEAKEGPIWNTKRAWNWDMENLFSLFVERLFDHPADQDLTWKNLHSLLQDKERNILYNYLNRFEDNKLRLQPDCADLPYQLRAYFAWKMRLPMAYRTCKRATKKKPPDCETDNLYDDNFMNRLELTKRWKRDKGFLKPRSDLEAFDIFVKHYVSRAAHSSTGRTHPDDEFADLIPVRLRKRALKPGTVYVDPYGHVMIVAKWIPQTAKSYGMLIAADAQPDGTVGRRRFWRGSFLFKPETRVGGAGFKAFRTTTTKREETFVGVETEIEVVEVPRIAYTEQAELRRLKRNWRGPRYSKEQYKGSAEDFYVKMEGLINPLPLDPVKWQLSLVDALAEAVARRVNSVNNGEEYLAKNPGTVMPMPDGRGIFLSSAPWELYSTPSRDIRLLISIDSVLGFPKTVRNHPARFGLKADGDLDAQVGRVKAALAKALSERTMQYAGSDGKAVTLRLQQIIDRQKNMEMAYNPNDCPEIRWGAPKDSDEYRTCNRFAPPEQRAKMQKLRGWFSSRERPAN